MIEFEHKLPAMNINGKQNGTYNNRELGYPSILTTTDYQLGEFLHMMRNNIYADRALVFVDDKVMMCNKNWIRDHVHVMKAMRHWEYDLDSFLNFIIDTQREDDQFYELIKQYDDYHWKYVNEDCYVMYPEDNLSLVARKSRQKRQPHVSGCQTADKVKAGGQFFCKKLSKTCIIWYNIRIENSVIMGC